MKETAAHPFELSRSSAAEYSLAVGINVKRYRAHARLNKKTLCLMANISRPFLDKIESGRANPQLSVIVRLAEALEVSPSDLITPPFATTPHIPEHTPNRPRLR